MTFKEYMKKNHPLATDDDYAGGVFGCPYAHRLEVREDSLANCEENGGRGCEYCWSREMPAKLRWIRMSEEQPVEEGRYLILRRTTKYGNPVEPAIKRWDGETFVGVQWLMNVLYWMPIPEAPEGIDADG